MRIFGEITPEDAENEGRMLSELCSPGRSQTVVEVRRHGWLPRHPSLYYIDMEYCPQTLESHIHGSVDTIRETRHAVRLNNESDAFSNELPVPTSNPNPSTTNIDLESEDAVETEFEWQAVVAIVEDISQGLVYLHEKHVVHRDLKPKNGKIRS